jgi:hypothetical protein
MAAVAGPPGPAAPLPPAPPPVAAPAPAAREIWLSVPPQFDGNCKKYINFIQAVLLYIGINNHIFANNDQKVGFTLSYMTEKEAVLWQDAWIRQNQVGGTLVYPTWATFLAEINAAFKPFDDIGEAMHLMQQLRQGAKTAEELNTEWTLLARRAEIMNAGDVTLINLYQKTLNWPLLEKILDGENVPSTIQGWLDKAIQMDNNYRRKMAILGKMRDNRAQQNTGRRFFRPFNQYTQNKIKDPNAMDVDVLSTKQWEEAMRKGACFGCGEVGHISCNCPKKNRGYSQGGQGGNTGQAGQSGTAGKTWNKGKDLLTHIRTLTAGLPADELEEFMKGAEESGF